ncbi:MAG TPA: LacI family DNA-binding transcriptional regulator [Acidobacteriaceae bacterium]|nr:LacI family DNA-binding transcriptional regulator [Acidobacteriaceae bacterium]
MKQIARMAGVSLGTVSHVMNDSARVREPLRRRVLDAVEALGYQPSALARGLRRDKTNMIGMIIPDVTNPFFPAVVRGAEDVAFANGYRLVLCNTDNNHAKELEHLNQLRTYLPSGLIVIPSNFSKLSEQVESFRRSGAAVVCLDRMPRHWKGDTVTVANEDGAFRATQYLIQLGHRRLAAITGPLHLTNAQERLAGFKRALKHAKISIAAGYVQESTFDRAGGYSKATVLLRMRHRPTAIFAQNDLMAMGVLLAIRELGLRCPQDVSVMGFDDLDVTELMDPPLATIHQPGYQLGATAVQMLLDQVKGREGPAQHCVLKTELRVRESVAPPSVQKRAARSKRRS